METLARLREAGKIQHVALSNVTLEHLERARKIVPIVSVQNRYSFADREWDFLLDHCEKNGIAFIPWAPLGQNRQAHDLLDRIAKELDATPLQVALAWLLARSKVILPIPGTSSVAHVEENIAAAGLEAARSRFPGTFRVHSTACRPALNSEKACAISVTTGFNLTCYPALHEARDLLTALALLALSSAPASPAPTPNLPLPARRPPSANRAMPHVAQGSGFDYYLLNLSWSPEFCYSHPERHGVCIALDLCPARSLAAERQRRLSRKLLECARPHRSIILQRHLPRPGPAATRVANPRHLLRPQRR